MIIEIPVNFIKPVFIEGSQPADDPIPVFVVTRECQSLLTGDHTLTQGFTRT